METRILLLERSDILEFSNVDADENRRPYEMTR